MGKYVEMTHLGISYEFMFLWCYNKKIFWYSSYQEVWIWCDVETSHDQVFCTPDFKKGSCQFLAKDCAQYWLTA